MAPPTRKSISLTTPNQRASCSGLVTASQTRSRGTGKSMVRSIRSERVMGSPLKVTQNAYVFFYRGSSQVAYREYTRKNHNRQPRSCFLGGVRNKSKIREVVGVGLWKRFSSAMISSLRDSRIINYPDFLAGNTSTGLPSSNASTVLD